MSDLGFPSRGAMCPSQQFSEGHFVFLFFFGGGVTIFFLSECTEYYVINKCNVQE